MSGGSVSTDDQGLPPLRMNAYYFSFSETGVRCVDEILSAVVTAGKGYHHTEDWAEGGYVDQIQAAAGRAAALFAAAPELLDALRAVRGFMDDPQRECPLPVELASAVRIAIAKAEGRSNV